MSISTEITRLQNAKGAIKTAIEGKGVTVPTETLLGGYASLIDGITMGGLPAGINGAAYGAFIPSSDITSRTVTHGLGVVPVGIVCWCIAWGSDTPYRIVYTVLFNTAYVGTGINFASIGSCCYMNSTGTSKLSTATQSGTEFGTTTAATFGNNGGSGLFKTGVVYQWIAWY